MDKELIENDDPRQVARRGPKDEWELMSMFRQTSREIYNHRIKGSTICTREQEETNRTIANINNIIFFIIHPSFIK